MKMKSSIIELGLSEGPNILNRNCIKIPKAADFETAVSATGFGIFNIILLTCAIPCAFCSVYATSSLSLVIPAAQCDLDLSLVDKGMLNASIYVGMIASAVLWGFLADTLGRRKLLIYGYLLDFLSAFFCSFSQSMWLLIVFKFLSGFIICGPFAVLMSYLSEFHCIKYRRYVMIVVGIAFALANITLPSLAWLTIPQHWTITVHEDYIIRSWQIFLAFCSLPSFISCVLSWLLPESPKFLMSRGRNEEALVVFRKLYRLNNRKPEDEYPIKVLVDETLVDGKRVEKPVGMEAVKNGFKQMAPMFKSPMLFNGILLYTLQFLGLLGMNSMRLWLPQLFTIIDIYMENTNGTGTADLCTIISTVLHEVPVGNGTDVGDVPCTVMVEGDVYMNSIIVGSTSLVGYFLAGALIKALGYKKLLISGFMLAGSCGIGLYWATSKLTTLLLSSAYVAFAGICTTALIGVVVNLFPTSMRTMVISLSMMFGRTGSLFGTVVFPVLLDYGCLPPFFMVGACLLVAGALCLALPKTSKVALQ